MMRTPILSMIFILSCFSLSSTTFAAAAETSGQKGKVLHDKLCLSCHTGMFGGDGSGIYTRDDRRVHSFPGLEKQIGNCNHNLGFNLNKEQLANILDYLSQTYYMFEKK